MRAVQELRLAMNAVWNAIDPAPSTSIIFFGLLFNAEYYHRMMPKQHDTRDASIIKQWWSLATGGGCTHQLGCHSVDDAISDVKMMSLRCSSGAYK